MHFINTTKKLSQPKIGFTIVELIVVITTIGILATISIVSYANWKQQTTIAQLKSDLNGVASAMESARTFGNTYPTTIPTSFTPSNGVTLNGGGSANGKGFCVTATNGGTSYLITNDSTAIVGTCSVSDTFTRTNSAMSLGVADGGQIWQTDGSSYGISGNQGYMVNGGGPAWINKAVPATTVEMDIIYASSATESVITRLIDANNYLHVIINDGSFYLYKKDAGVWGQLAIVARTHTPGLTYQIKAEIVGNVFNGYENGVLVLSYVLTSEEQAKFLAANALGVGMRSNSSTVRYDNLVAM